MVNCEVIKRGKRAGVSVEFLLSITLAVVVLFATLRIFGDQLSTMTSNSGMWNMFNNKNKTTYTIQASPQTTVSIADPAEVPTQITGDQGLINLSDFVTKAGANVDYYDKNKPQTQAQVEDLAKCLTILQATGGTTAMTAHDGTALASQYGINIVIDSNMGSFVTQVKTDNVTGLTINEQFVYAQDLTSLSSQNDKLSAAQDIRDAKYTPMASQ